MKDQNKMDGLFIFVSKENTKNFQIEYKRNPEKYYDNIIFVLETKEIITHGTVFTGTSI